MNPELDQIKAAVYKPVKVKESTITAQVAAITTPAKNVIYRFSSGRAVRVSEKLNPYPQE
jgi:hypothetical protein